MCTLKYLLSNDSYFNDFYMHRLVILYESKFPIKNVILQGQRESKVFKKSTHNSLVSPVPGYLLSSLVSVGVSTHRGMHTHTPK